jgi:hypothetical protein
MLEYGAHHVGDVDVWLNYILRKDTLGRHVKGTKLL